MIFLINNLAKLSVLSVCLVPKLVSAQKTMEKVLILSCFDFAQHEATHTLHTERSRSVKLHKQNHYYPNLSSGYQN